MFRKRKGTDDGQGFNRISRLIEDRQREMDDDDAPLDTADEDTILMRPGTAAASSPSATGFAGDDDGDTVSLLSLRNRPETAAEPATPDQGQTPTPGDEPEYDATLPLSAARLTDYEREAPAPLYTPPARVEPEPMRVPDLGRGRADASLVAVDATWEGTLRSEGDIRVEGTLRGEIETAGTLVVAPHARVHGTVRAHNVMIGGDVEGEVNCEERLEILPGGSARGQINSDTLVVHEGAYIDSRFHMRREQGTGSG